VAGVVVLLAVQSMLSGCGGDEVDVRPTGVTGADREACISLVKALPRHVSDQSARTVTGETEVGAAWGDPAVVLRCGVGRPAGYTKFAACQTANGVDWFVPDEAMQDQGADVRMTTIGRSPSVEVLVPAEDRPPVAAMVDLAPTIKAHTRVTRRCS
jgi:hypothetical protein